MYARERVWRTFETVPIFSFVFNFYLADRYYLHIKREWKNIVFETIIRHDDERRSLARTTFRAREEPSRYAAQLGCMPRDHRNISTFAYTRKRIK